MRRPTACIELDRARRAGPSPRGEQRRRCPPARRCSLAPAGQPPLKLTGAATSAASGAANVISPSEGVHAVSAQQCGFGRGVASGPQVSVALPLSALLRHAMRCGCCGDHVSGRRSKSPAKSMLWRCCGSMGRAGEARARSIRPATAPFLTPPKWNATALRQCGQRTMEETVDCTILLERS
jgi:hypothetical protein